MKTSRFTDRKIISILKLIEDGSTVLDLCRKQRMSSASFYKWRCNALSIRSIKGALCNQSGLVDGSYERLFQRWARHLLFATIMAENDNDGGSYQAIP
ncbi:MAG: hypothetical protein ACI910_001264 [Oleispira sp.]|jgi:hypothetical protein